MSKYEWSKIIPQLMDVCKEAGSKMMALWNTEHIEINLKDDDSPVTQADRLSHDLISSELSTLTPDIPVVSEEHVYNHTADYRHQTFWLLDPLDGTKEFIAGRPDFCINLALIRHEEPVIGLLILPAYQITYWAMQGQGAYKTTALRPEQHLMPSNQVLSQDDQIRIVCSLNHLDPRTKEYLKLFPLADIKAFGGARKMISLAEKEADLYPRFGTTMEWDTAAPHIILRECGGELWDVASQRPITYGKPGFKNDSFIGTSTTYPPIFTS